MYPGAIIATTPTIIVHGGAGDWAEGIGEALDACRRAAERGLAVLAAAGSAVDAVVDAVRVLEDDPACNAGTGATLTSEGGLELDACLMDGSTLCSGAVAALPPFRHPIDVARGIMRDGRYQLMVGEGAARFAVALGFERADAASMITAARRAEAEAGGDRPPDGNTVGAVALDARGRLSAATSTGGRAGTPPGRVGDAPIVGAGTYADAIAACSCTGEGEAFARACAAFWATQQADGGARSAAQAAVARVRELFGGWGGMILLNHRGEVGVAWTALKMPHAIARSGSGIVVGG